MKKIAVQNGQPPFLRRWLTVSCLFSLLLLIIRILISHQLSYAFLAWNLFLAYVPYFISEWIGQHRSVVSRWPLITLLLLVWLVFMPNSFYIFTDLFHLNTLKKGDSWFDLTLILSFAWNGMLFGVLSIHRLESVLAFRKGRLMSILVTGAVMWLNAFGIYLGRFLRYNTWDVITNPLSLSQHLAGIALNPYDHRYALVMTSCFALFMTILYYTIREMSLGFSNAALEKPVFDRRY